MSEPNSHAHLWPGVPLALGSAILFGAAPPLCKLLLDSVNPFILAGLLYLGAGAGLALYRLLRGKQAAAGEAQLTAGDIPWLALAIGMGGIVAPVLLMFGLSLNTASSSALLLNLEGLATMAIAWLVYRENVDRRLLLGAFSILAGAILLSSAVWTMMHLQYNWFFLAQVFSIGLLLGYLRYLSNSTWLTVVLHGLNNLAATVQTIWLANNS